MDSLVFVCFRTEVQAECPPVMGHRVIHGGSRAGRRYARVTQEPLQVEGFGMNPSRKIKEKVRYSGISLAIQRMQHCAQERVSIVKLVKCAQKVLVKCAQKL